MRYAILAAQEARPPEKPKRRLDQVLGYLNNGFVLLLLGSLITSALVPHFQREYERRTKRSALMQECLSQFLLYSNSIWQEYYTILPLTLEGEIGKDEYVRAMNEISQIKLKRYDAYAKTLALALVFRGRERTQASRVEKALNDYAVLVNSASQAVDTWVRNLYCVPIQRSKSPCASFDATFDSYVAYENIQRLILQIGNERTQDVAELMVEEIKSPDF
jgi:hypothetical protein